jgi:hypothetical protein
LELIGPKRKKIFWDFVGSHGCPLPRPPLS